MSESDDFVKKTNKRKKQVEKKPKKDQKEPKAKKSKVEKPSPEKTEEEEEEEEEEYKWWKDDQADDSVKWTTLQHAGPLFPPPYVPHGIKMKYDGVDVDLSPEAEEVASFYAALIGSDYVENKTFRDNFFSDFLAICKCQPTKNPIKVFEKCDFTPITNHLLSLKDAKKNSTKADKLKIKEEKEALDLQYGWALLNGRKEKVGNYRIEPPGLFRGRGVHPKTGTLKKRVFPEQVTINIGKDAIVPTPPAGHEWGNVQNDNTVSWLATWKDNVNDNIKYVFLAANSSLKGQSDFKKFEKARALKEHVEEIRAKYTVELKDKEMAIRQRATALYLIDKLALRAGNEKGEDEADTVGCCSLRYEHITLELPNLVVFDFLGKDSMRYYNSVPVDDQVFKNLKLFKKEPKTDGDSLFDRLSTPLLNKYLGELMPGLTAKVFRTFNASFVFQQELIKTGDGAVAEKILAYNRANRQVAILCNHQRSVGKAHGAQIGKMQDKLNFFKYERYLVRNAMIKDDPKLKKTLEELDVFDEEEKTYIVNAMLKTDLDKIKTKIVKANDKIKKGEDTEGVLTSDADIEKLLKEKEDEVGVYIIKEKIEKMDSEKLMKRHKLLSGKIDECKLTMVDKEEGKTTALGTSKINYIDPRISAAWCYKNDVPIEKIFNKALLEKFRWALDVDKDWEF